MPKKIYHVTNLSADMICFFDLMVYIWSWTDCFHGFYKIIQATINVITYQTFEIDGL